MFVISLCLGDDGHGNGIYKLPSLMLQLAAMFVFHRTHLKRGPSALFLPREALITGRGGRCWVKHLSMAAGNEP